MQKTDKVLSKSTNPNKKSGDMSAEDLPTTLKKNIGNKRNVIMEEDDDAMEIDLDLDNIEKPSQVGL